MRDRLNQFPKLFRTGLLGSLSASEPPDPIGALTPLETVELSSDSLGWLVGAVGEDGEMHTETVDLATTEGEFTFTAEGDRIVITYFEEADD